MTNKRVGPRAYNIMSEPIFKYGEDHLKASLALDITKGTVKGVLSAAGRQQVRNGARLVEAIVASGTVVYGINTGFGPLCTTLINRNNFV